MYSIILCAADHGVAKMNVSAFDAKITKTMVRNYLVYKGAALNAFADFINAPITLANLGMKEDFSHQYLFNEPIRRGTNNIFYGAAMTREEAKHAIEIGRKLCQRVVSNGAKYILPAEMGIGNTTSSASLAAALLNLPAEKVTGRGTNISDDKLLHKINVVKRAVEINAPYIDAVDILAKLGGFELGGITGIILEAAERNVKVILDGLNTTVSALIASRIDTNVNKILLPSHLAGEAAHKFLLEELKLIPVMDLDFHLGEACGSSIMAKYMELEKNNFETLNNSGNVLIPKNITEEARRNAENLMRERFFNLSMPHHALGALEDIAIKLAGEYGTININENIPLNKNYLDKLGITDEKYAINKKRLPHLAEVLARASLYIINRMKTFDEAKIL